MGEEGGREANVGGRGEGGMERGAVQGDLNWNQVFDITSPHLC